MLPCIHTHFTFSFNQITLLKHQPDPYHQKSMYPKMAYINQSVLDLYKKVSFQSFFDVQFQQAYLNNQLTYGDETLHKDWNP
jgi:hypothetical protein